MQKPSSPSGRFYRQCSAPCFIVKVVNSYVATCHGEFQGNTFSIPRLRPVTRATLAASGVCNHPPSIQSPNLDCDLAGPEVILIAMNGLNVSLKWPTYIYLAEADRF
jgi:hypothetical protein